MIDLAVLVPHPPIIISEVGGAEAQQAESTIKGMHAIASLIEQAAPETLIVISPHAPIFSDAVAIYGKESLRGDLSRFGASSAAVRFENDLALAEMIAAESMSGLIPAVIIDENLRKRYRLSDALDHGATVPLLFLKNLAGRCRLITMGFAMQSYESLYRFGMCLAGAVRESGRRTVLIASGDLSHRLTPDAPNGFDPSGPEFDRQLMAAIAQMDVRSIMSMDADMIEQAGECGLRSLIIMLGALDGVAVQSEVKSYEGPFGVGYSVAAFFPGKADQGRNLAAIIENDKHQRGWQRMASESPLVRLARQTLQNALRGQTPDQLVAVEFPQDLKEKLPSRAGVFVSLKKDGQLRGCIGTIEPTTASVADEIRQNAVSAAFRDTRFDPVSAEELDDLVISVDVLYPAESIGSINELDPRKYGVIVRKGHRSGLLLPDLEGVNTVQQQVAIAKKKASLGPEEEVDLYRFEVQRFK
ncbi:MAG TPA: AMMECR1 domain-containing protein [Firmicutes bacterium]|jgi:AmmeMemoRadiSam system protein A/AmmeMemoRadiSam system protein B|nr:AMMECR1 domain-containing protein [Bacillota bacterium]